MEKYALKIPQLKGFLESLKNPAWLCFLWVGMTAGISFIEAPAKFSAASLTRPVALDVGRVVFAALNKAELAMLIALLIVVRVSGRAREYLAFIGALTLIVLAQSAWLLPELAARAESISAGVEPPSSPAHMIYGILEIVKLLLLLILGFRTLNTRQVA